MSSSGVKTLDHFSWGQMQDKQAVFFFNGQPQSLHLVKAVIVFGVLLKGHVLQIANLSSWVSLIICFKFYSTKLVEIYLFTKTLLINK